MAISSTASIQAPFPETVGKYELLLPIGTGGMATVYLARSTGVGGFERDVALKLVHAHLRADEESKIQLLEEAKLAARIRHPNVVPVLEVDEDPFGLFLVMDYVEGDTLSGLVRATKNTEQKLTSRLIARILNDALLGLHAAHELKSTTGSCLNLVHRDFSPQNILISIQGMTRLGDFGVAKAADRAVRTKTGLVKGKISYMSPEQARGHDVDRRCDVWAAGVVAWELIAGRRLHAAEDDVSTLLSIVTQHPARLSDVCEGIPKPLDDALAWALTPDVSERCPTAEALRQRLETAWLEGDGIATQQELGEFVSAAISDKLAERAKSVREVRRLRQRMGQLTRTPVDETSRTASASKNERIRTEIGSGPRVHLASSPADGGSVPATQSAPPSSRIDQEESTRFDGIGATAREAQPDGPPTEEKTAISAVVPAFATKAPASRLAVAGLAAAAVLGAGALWMVGQRQDSTGIEPSQISDPASGAVQEPSLHTPVEPVSPPLTKEPAAVRAPSTEVSAAPTPAPTVSVKPNPGTVDPPSQSAQKVRAKSKPVRSPKSRTHRQVPAAETKDPPESRKPSKPGLATNPYARSKSAQQ